MTVWVAMMEGMSGSFVLGVYDSEELAKNALAHCNEICKNLDDMVDPIAYYFHTDMNSIPPDDKVKKIARMCAW